MRLERFRQRASGPDALLHVVQHGIEERIGHPTAQDIERLHERHAGFEQRRQLLIEDQELAHRHARPRRQRKSAEREAPGALDAEDVEALLLELAPEPRLAVGGVYPSEDLATRSSQPAAKFH